MRGTIGGNGDTIVDASLQVNSALRRGYEINQSGSHTLQSRDFEDAQTLQTRLIDATVQALAEGSGPRLYGSRL